MTPAIRPPRPDVATTEFARAILQQLDGGRAWGAAASPSDDAALLRRLASAPHLAASADSAAQKALVHERLRSLPPSSSASALRASSAALVASSSSALRSSKKLVLSSSASRLPRKDATASLLSASVPALHSQRVTPARDRLERLLASNSLGKERLAARLSQLDEDTGGSPLRALTYTAPRVEPTRFVLKAAEAASARERHLAEAAKQHADAAPVATFDLGAASPPRPSTPTTSLADSPPPPTQHLKPPPASVKCTGAHELPPRTAPSSSTEGLAPGTRPPTRGGGFALTRSASTAEVRPASRGTMRRGSCVSLEVIVGERSGPASPLQPLERGSPAGASGSAASGSPLLADDGSLARPSTAASASPEGLPEGRETAWETHARSKGRAGGMRSGMGRAGSPRRRQSTPAKREHPPLVSVAINRRWKHTAPTPGKRGARPHAPPPPWTPVIVPHQQAMAAAAAAGRAGGQHAGVPLRPRRALDGLASGNLSLDALCERMGLGAHGAHGIVVRGGNQVAPPPMFNGMPRPGSSGWR